MKLTLEEEEVIEISDEDRLKDIEECSQSLIGKFLTCKPFNKKAAQNTPRRSWGLDEDLQIVEVASNLFQFKFKSDFELERVLKGGPWTFDNQALMLRRWQPGMTAANVKLDSIALWIQIWDAPFDMISPIVAAEIGNRLGKVVEVEKRRTQDIQNFFMRVKVELLTSKPIRRGAFIGGSEGVRSWVTFKYERLPIFCHFCRVLGHDLKHCAKHFARMKNNREVECQYSDWLRLMGAGIEILHGK
ncbi:uncharacterized protein LOC112027205 [Quercus suber]|uniref:uncharacterized protein LOC112027205 n=1 Tax=Quercus suber TaxID=58331 RepID=UPI0032DF03C6